MTQSLITPPQVAVALYVRGPLHMQHHQAKLDPTGRPVTSVKIVRDVVDMPATPEQVRDMMINPAQTMGLYVLAGTRDANERPVYVWSGPDPWHEINNKRPDPRDLNRMRDVERVYWSVRSQNEPGQWQYTIIAPLDMLVGVSECWGLPVRHEEWCERPSLLIEPIST